MQDDRKRYLAIEAIKNRYYGLVVGMTGVCAFILIGLIIPAIVAGVIVVLISGILNAPIFKVDKGAFRINAFIWSTSIVASVGCLLTLPFEMRRLLILVLIPIGSIAMQYSPLKRGTLEEIIRRSSRLQDDGSA